MKNLSSHTFHRLTHHHLSMLKDFFLALTQHHTHTYFHPHPFDEATARAITHYQGKDFYSALIHQNTITGYGMLRGYDEGYKIPSLGIAIHPDYQGQGLGHLLMCHLHDTARLLGSTQIRLKVYPENQSALTLYQKLGYQFTSQEGSQLIGILNLPPNAKT